MDIRQLRYFIAVAEHLNFTVAANSIYVTQSNISRQISDLETELGLKLFNRTKQYVRLTDAGTVFLKEARAVIARIDEAIQKTRETASGLVGSLKIGFIGAATKSFLPEFINYFRKKYSQIGLYLVDENWDYLNNGLTKEEFDVCFTLDLGIHNAPGISIKKIYTDPLSLVLRSDHPLAEKALNDFSSLYEEPFIYLEKQMCIDNIVKICEDRGFTPNFVQLAPRIDNVLFLIESGIGIAILPHFVESYASPAIRLIDLDGSDATIDIIITWKKSNINPSVPLLISEFENFVTSNNGNFKSVVQNTNCPSIS